MMPGPQAPVDPQPPACSAGVVVARRDSSGWRLLVLRAYRNWDFPKGRVEPGETPLDAAIRETAEEAGISDLALRWGEGYCETLPYRQGKVARYYLAETTRTSIPCRFRRNWGAPNTTSGAGWASTRPSACCRRGCGPFWPGRESSSRHECSLTGPGFAPVQAFWTDIAPCPRGSTWPPGNHPRPATLTRQY